MDAASTSVQPSGDLTGSPLISVVTPSFNQAPFLERALKSVLEQGYPRLEYMVFDGASTDGSVEIIQRFATGLAFWTSEKDDGQASVVNAGWRRATGEILGWLNSDDYYVPGTFAYVVEYFTTHPETTMVYGTSILVDEAGREFGRTGAPFDMRRALLGRYMVPQPSVFIRRRALDQVGMLDESLYYAMDLDFFLRLAVRQDPSFVPRDLSGSTIHSGAKMSKGRAAARQERFRVAARHAHGLTRILIPILALRARIFHTLPMSWKRRIDEHRGVPTPGAG